jgi:hypothetical protein
MTLMIGVCDGSALSPGGHPGLTSARAWERRDAVKCTGYPSKDSAAGARLDSHDTSRRLEEMVNARSDGLAGAVGSM